MQKQFCIFFPILQILYLFIKIPEQAISKIFFFIYARLQYAAAIQCLETNTVSYTSYQTLILRYNNKKLHVQVHTKSIFDMLTISEEASELRRFVDKVISHINSFEKYKWNIWKKD